MKKEEKLSTEIMTTNEEIKNLIYTIRGKQVMLDSDVAMLYHYETRKINQAVKRNIERFPKDFCFQLNEKEVLNMQSQFVTALKNENKKRNKTKLPYAFTEQGIAMLSGLLKNDTAISTSIRIMNAFVQMRKFLTENGHVFERLTKVEYGLLECNEKIDSVFNQLQGDKIIKQRIFFEGQIYDAYNLIIDIIKKADNRITIIDNYIDDSILKMLTKKKKDVKVMLLTSRKSNISELDIQKFNKEYPTLNVTLSDKFHDRFIILDNKELYHCGASIKDLGKKCFAITKVENEDVIKLIGNIA